MTRNLSFWLMKSEPYKYSWDDLKRDGSTYWDGVRNYGARNNLKAMKKEDLSDRSILIGSPDKIISSLKGVEASGIDEVILYFNVGRKPHQMVKDQMQRFAEEIAPEFK